MLLRTLTNWLANSISLNKLSCSMEWYINGWKQNLLHFMHNVHLNTRYKSYNIELNNNLNRLIYWEYIASQQMIFENIPPRTESDDPSYTIQNSSFYAIFLDYHSYSFILYHKYSFLSEKNFSWKSTQFIKFLKMLEKDSFADWFPKLNIYH